VRDLAADPVASSPDLPEIPAGCALTVYGDLVPAARSALDAFLAAGEAALTTRAATGEELESDRLKARLGAALIERDLLHEKIVLLEADHPFARRRRKP